MVHSIHPRTIQEVKEKADIVDVISEHIVLKKKGKEFVGICPFHDDTKPSMTVSPSKQFYYCFSCGAGGNSIKFLMEFTRANFSDVVLSLGMIGTVIGFMVMLSGFKELDISDIQTAQEMLTQLASGMSMALITTAAGLIASVLLKLQFFMLETRLLSMDK